MLGCWGFGDFRLGIGGLRVVDLTRLIRPAGPVDNTEAGAKLFFFLLSPIGKCRDFRHLPFHVADFSIALGNFDELFLSAGFQYFNCLLLFSQ